MRPGALGLAGVLTLCLVSTRAGLAQTPPYPQSPLIAGVTFDFSTHVRQAGGSDNWPLTWAADDHQYTSWGDGGGFSGGDSECRVSLGIARIEANVRDLVGHDVWGDPACTEHPAQFGGKTRTIIDIDGTLYFWGSPGSDVSGLDHQRLYKSIDNAATFLDTGVEWTYAQHQIGLFAFLQMGKAYQAARDPYVYIYATNIQSFSWGTQKPGELHLIRVPKAGIESQSQYQFFKGLNGCGQSLWGTFTERRPVFVDPNGVMRNSAIYNPGLRRYFLVTNHTENNRGNVAIFDAPEPWGPWTTVLYELGWPAGGEVERNVFFANFSAKWWSADGQRFVFVFTGKSTNDSFNAVEGSFRLAGCAGAAPASPGKLRSLPWPDQPEPVPVDPDPGFRR